MSRISDAEAKLAELAQKIEGSDDYNPVKDNNQTRSILAKIVVKGYFAIVCGSIVVFVVYNMIAKAQLDLADTVLKISSIPNAIIGFVLGHYFRGSDK